MGRLEFTRVPKFSSRQAKWFLADPELGQGHRKQQQVSGRTDEAWDPQCFAFPKPVREAGKAEHD